MTADNDGWPEPSASKFAMGGPISAPPIATPLANPGRIKVLPATKTGIRPVAASTADEAQGGTPVVMSLTFVLIWALQTYIKGIPDQVTAALYMIIPYGFAWLSTHVTIKKVTL